MDYSDKQATKHEEYVKSDHSRLMLPSLDFDRIVFTPTVLEVNPQDIELMPRSRSGTHSPRSFRSRSRRASEESEKEVEPEKEDKSDQQHYDNLLSRRLTIAGGFLDIALFTQNSQQLKSVLEIKDIHPYFDTAVGLLITSMVLQVLCFITLFMIGCLVIRHPRDRTKAEILNHLTMGLIGLITIVNIFISTFTVKGEVLKGCSSCLVRQARGQI